MAGRTDEQRKAICMQALSIEKQGGDVLGFLKKVGYPYTPQATWRNMQRDFLKRKEWNMTDGRPIEKKEKEGNEMPKGGSTVRHHDSSALAEDVASAVIYHDADPIEYLENMGYLQPKQKWAQLKRVLKEENPELLKGVEIALGMAGEEKPEDAEESEDPGPAKEKEAEKKPKAAKQAEAPQKPQKAPQEPGNASAKKLPSEASETPRDEKPAKTDSHARPIATCCAPARPSGVTLADMEGIQPKEQELTIRAVENRLGTFMVTEYGMTFLQKEPENGPRMHTLHLTVEEWGMFLAAVPKAMRMLGMIK